MLTEGVRDQHDAVSQEHRGRTGDPSLDPFGGSTDLASRLTDEPVNFIAIQHDDDFVRLRRRLLHFVFPMTALFLGWYFCYVLLAAYARSFMSFRLFGEINVGLVLGLLQFVSTVLITIWYVRFAKRDIDPEVERIRARAGMAPAGTTPA
jgi:uncharacterized membrane protein (DUF485 family)